jgi:hypothetical protein
MSWPPFSISPTAHARTVVLRSAASAPRVVQERLAMTADLAQPDRGHDISRRIASLR